MKGLRSLSILLSRTSSLSLYQNHTRRDDNITLSFAITHSVALYRLILLLASTTVRPAEEAAAVAAGKNTAFAAPLRSCEVVVRRSVDRPLVRPFVHPPYYMVVAQC